MATRQKLNSLTGLRGIAALLVVIDHYSAWCAPYPEHGAPFDAIFNLGGIGMSVFFTLSGFVIAYNYSDLPWAARPSASSARFLWLRFSRLYPAFLLFLILTATRPHAMAELGAHYGIVTAISLFAAQSFYPVRAGGDIITQNGYNISWSISTEIGLYLIFVVAIIFLRFGERWLGRAARWWALALAALYVALILWATGHEDAVVGALRRLPAVAEVPSRDNLTRWFFYNSPYFRFYDFLWGCLAAVLVKSSVRHLDRCATYAAVTLIGCAGLFLARPGTIPIQVLAPPLLAVVMASSRRSTVINRALGARWLVFVGEISFSLYLFHPLASHLADVGHDQPFDFCSFSEFVELFALSLLLAIAMAYGLYSILEMPAQRLLRSVLRVPTALPVEAK